MTLGYQSTRRRGCRSDSVCHCWATYVARSDRKCREHHPGWCSGFGTISGSATTTSSRRLLRSSRKIANYRSGDSICWQYFLCPILVRFLVPTSTSILQIVPVYCFDPRHFQKSQYASKRWGVVRNPKAHFKHGSQSGPKKCGVIRAKFLLESVIDLKRRLESIGSGLLVFVGRPEEILPKLMANDARTIVLTQVAFFAILSRCCSLAECYTCMCKSRFLFMTALN